VSSAAGGATALVAALAFLVAGCGSAPPEPRLGEPGDAPGDADAGPKPGQSVEEQVVRGWSQAVNRGEYERAADFFAPGAVVEQVAELRLRTHADAVAFNRGLPCRADVTDVKFEGRSTLAAFRLRTGRGGECTEGGRARVRFVIRDDRILEWRQLPPQPAPPGEVA
jgi:hypothetical protein